MQIAFHWVRDPEKRFQLRTYAGERVISLASRAERASLVTYSPLQPKESRPRLSAEARGIILALVNVETEAEALQFVNYYGPLTAAGWRTMREPVRVITNAAEEFRDLIAALADSSVEAGNRALGADADILEFNFGTLQTEISPEGPKWVMNLRIPDLLGALKFMMAEKLAHGSVYKRCPRCTDLFDVGEGTSRTVAAVYCSKDCQIKNKRAEGKGL